MKHTRTGNPLVDSVAEHQPTSKQAYTQYLSHAYDLVPVRLRIIITTGLGRHAFIMDLFWHCLPLRE